MVGLQEAYLSIIWHPYSTCPNNQILEEYLYFILLAPPSVHRSILLSYVHGLSVAELEAFTLPHARF